MAVTRRGLVRRSFGVIASGCVAAVFLSGCDSRGQGAPVAADPSPSGNGSELSAVAMQSIADRLRRSVPCQDPDALQDDLAFWDAMRGYDCLAGADSTFIRVYAHAASVPQTLEDWQDTLGSDRDVVRGANWYVIGPPAVIDAMDVPRDTIPGGEAIPEKLTAEQDYLTTCVRFVASEGERYVERPGARGRSAKQYETLFPGVIAELHAAIDDLGRKRVRRIPDTERWTAALSPIGPRLKAKCVSAYEKVRSTVQPVEGSR